MKYLVEFIGTFVFLSIILNVKEPYKIALTLLVLIYLGSKISGAHYNPAVSFMMYFEKKLSFNVLMFYIIAQLAGGFSAFYFNKLIKK